MSDNTKFDDYLCKLFFYQMCYLLAGADRYLPKDSVINAYQQALVCFKNWDGEIPILYDPNFKFD